MTTRPSAARADFRSPSGRSATAASASRIASGGDGAVRRRLARHPGLGELQRVDRLTAQMGVDPVDHLDPHVVQVHRRRAGAGDGQHAAVESPRHGHRGDLGADDDLPVRDDLGRGRVVLAKGPARDVRHQAAQRARPVDESGPVRPYRCVCRRPPSASGPYLLPQATCCVGTTATGDGCHGGRSPARRLIRIASG